MHEYETSRHIANALGPENYDKVIEKIPDEFWSLTYLMCAKWFVENVGNFVIIPTVLVLVIGVAIESQRAKKRSDSAP